MRPTATPTKLRRSGTVGQGISQTARRSDHPHCDISEIRPDLQRSVRIFFGVGGPNKTSAFHVIGEIFDQVHPLGSVTADATPDVQTVNVAPGGAMIAELTLEVPGQYVLVDHALSRVERGLAAILEVEGPADPAIFDETAPAS
jgi:nitrite reductase (NO-forming)